MQDVVNTMRTMAEISRIQQIAGERIIILEGTAEQVAMAEKLAAEIDKGKRRFGGLGYRLDLKVQESESDKPVQTKRYSFLTETHDAARVNAGTEVPAHAQNEPAAEKKQSSDSANTRIIECLIMAENEHTIELNVELIVASSGDHGSGAANSAPLRIRQHVTLELDKPTVISAFEDPYGKGSFTVEVTATRVKERS